MEIEKYISLISRYLSREINSLQFEDEYLRMFISESKIHDESVYATLNNLFLDVDAYCSDPALREEEDLDEEELLRRAKAALEDLLNTPLGYDNYHRS